MSPPREANTLEILRRFTIKLGKSHGRRNDWLTVMDKAGIFMSGPAFNILGNEGFTIARQESQVDLAVVSAGHLCSRRRSYLEQVYRKARKAGLGICPAEVGLQLRLQHTDNSRNECLHIGMEPIADSRGDLNVLSVVCDLKKLWLSTFWGDPFSLCYANSLWVFMNPKKL